MGVQVSFCIWHSDIRFLTILKNCQASSKFEAVNSTWLSSCQRHIWFLVHQAILHSWGEISVLLVLWQCCWGLSGVQSSKSRLLTCLIGKTQLLWTQCSRIGPHLAARGKSHVFSWVAAGTWDIFSSYGGDVHSKLESVQWGQDTCLGMRDNSRM